MVFLQKELFLTWLLAFLQSLIFCIISCSGNLRVSILDADLRLKYEYKTLCVLPFANYFSSRCEFSRQCNRETKFSVTGRPDLPKQAADTYTKPRSEKQLVGN